MSKRPMPLSKPGMVWMKALAAALLETPIRVCAPPMMAPVAAGKMAILERMRPLEPAAMVAMRAIHMMMVPVLLMKAD